MKHKKTLLTLKRSFCLAMCIISVLLCACQSGNVTQTDTDSTKDTAQPPASEDTDAKTDTPTYSDTSEFITENASTQTDAVTDDPTLTQTTETPVILDTFSHAYDRLIVFGTCESNAKITYWKTDNVQHTDMACGKYFYIEIYGFGKNTITLKATADGKKSSEEITFDVTHKTAETAVFSGKNSRLYLRGTEGYLLGHSSTTKDHLENTANFLKNRVSKIQSLTGKDTKLIFLLAPNPVEIYYDEMYDYLTFGNRKSTAVSQFVTYMNSLNDSDIIVPDLFSAYDQHKNEDIYFRTDTHWSELGAFYAYDAMMNEVKKSFPNVIHRTLNDFDIEYRDCPAGDMANMLGAAGILREETPFLMAKFSDTGDFYPVKRDAGDIICNIPVGKYPAESLISNKNLPTAHVIGDSYGAFFLPFVGMSFSRVTTNPGVLWNYTIDYDKIADDKPDYIIFVYTERNIGGDFMQLMVE